MGQLGFFDADRRLAALSEKGDPLEAITALVPWESFRAEIEAVVLRPDEAKKSKAGRKPFDAIMMFRMCCNRCTICRTCRSSIKFGIGPRSRDLSVLGRRIAFPTARRCG